MLQNKIAPLFFYFKRIVKFYDIKARGVPQVLFVLLLAASFGLSLAIRPFAVDYSIYLQQVYNTYMDILSSESINDTSALLGSIIGLQNSEMFSRLISVSLKILGFTLLQEILLNVLAYFYLGAYLCDLESGTSSFSGYLRKVAKALPRYAVFNIIFYVALIIVFAFALFIFAVISSFIPVFYFAVNLVIYLIPVAWFVVRVIFVFKDITFLDTGVSVWRNFRLSAELSAGNRMMIARNIFFIVFLNLLIRIFTVESQLVSLFIISFLEIIILLIKQRLIALMYLTRTRKMNDIVFTEINN